MSRQSGLRHSDKVEYDLFQTNELTGNRMYVLKKSKEKKTDS